MLLTADHLRLRVKHEKVFLGAAPLLRFRAQRVWSSHRNYRRAIIQIANFFVKGITDDHRDPFGAEPCANFRQADLIGPSEVRLVVSYKPLLLCVTV
jgi:hypothetical protein